VFIVAVAAAGPVSGSAPAGIETSLQVAKLGGVGPSASASGGSTVLTLNGTAVSSRTSVTIDAATGELVVREATQARSPGTPCTPAEGTVTTEFRCPPGSIGAIVGDLDLGNDSFLVARNVPVFIGAIVGGTLSPMSGGRGRDIISGGGAGDALSGSIGRDRLIGKGGQDLLNGGAGGDRLLGGRAADLLRGGPGRDRHNGGPGRDLCAGGGGVDRQRSCFRTRGIP
jgi:hypothetical protein